MEKQSEIVHSYFYQRHSPNTKNSDICLWVFKSSQLRDNQLFRLQNVPEVYSEPWEKAVHYFRNRLHLRYFTGFWERLCLQIIIQM